MIKRRSLIRAYTFGLALFAVMGYYLYGNMQTADQYKLYADNAYSRSVNELAGEVESLATELERAQLSASPAMINGICTKAYASAESAVTAMSSIPNSAEALSETASFISKCGDYAMYLAKNAAAGYVPTSEEMSNLKKITSSVRNVADELGSAAERLRNGEICVDSICTDENVEDVTLTGTFKKVEASLLNAPTLNYDGKFSDHINSLTAKFTNGQNEISEDDALQVAERFTGVAKDKFAVQSVDDPAMPVYSLTSDGVFIEITKNGGYVKSCFFSRPVEFTRYSGEDAVKKAEEYVSHIDLPGLKTINWHIEDNRCTVRMSHCENNVTCYADELKIVVALDTLDIIGFYTGDYLMNHTSRTIEEPTVAQSDAEGRLSEGLNVQNRSLAMIQTDGKNEKLCHEFTCTDSDGNQKIIYVDGATGFEERIDISSKDNNGTLIK